jgi:hypothetical protein
VQLSFPVLLLLFNALFLLLTLHIMPPAMANGSRCIPPISSPVPSLVSAHWDSTGAILTNNSMKYKQSMAF